MASKPKTNKPKTLAYNSLAPHVRQDVRAYAQAVKGADPAQHAPGTVAFLAYRVAFYAAVMAEGGALPPVAFRPVVGFDAKYAPWYELDTDAPPACVYLSDAFAVMLALYLGGKRAFPRL